MHETRPVPGDPLGLITFSDLIIVGPLFLALYLLNAYMGIKLANQEKPDHHISHQE